MKFIKNLKIFSGFGRCTYSEIILYQIERVKQLFTLDLCQGDEVMIPIELHQVNLAPSYRFYDPLLKMVHIRVNRKEKNFYSLKYDLNMQRLFDDKHLLKKVKQVTGLDNYIKDSKPKDHVIVQQQTRLPVYRYHSVEERTLQGIDFS